MAANQSVATFPVHANRLLESSSFKCIIRIGPEDGSADATKKLRLLLFSLETTETWDLLQDVILLKHATLQFMIENPRSGEKEDRKTAFKLLGSFWLGKTGAIKATGEAQYCSIQSIVQAKLSVDLDIKALFEYMGVKKAEMSCIDGALSWSPIDIGKKMKFTLSAKVSTTEPKCLSALIARGDIMSEDVPLVVDNEALKLTLCQMYLEAAYDATKKDTSFILKGSISIGSDTPLRLSASLQFSKHQGSDSELTATIEASETSPATIAKKLWGGSVFDDPNLPTLPEDIIFSNWRSENATGSGTQGFAEISIRKQQGSTYKVTSVTLGLRHDEDVQLVKDNLWLTHCRLFFKIDLPLKKNSLQLSCKATLTYKIQGSLKHLEILLAVKASGVTFTINIPANVTTNDILYIATAGGIDLPTELGLPLFPTIEAELNWEEWVSRLTGYFVEGGGEWKLPPAFGLIAAMKSPRLEASITLSGFKVSIKGTARYVKITYILKCLVLICPLAYWNTTSRLNLYGPTTSD
jgi:hypothetical protein